MLKRIEVKASTALAPDAVKRIASHPDRWYACITDGEHILEVIDEQSVYVTKEQAQKSCDRYMRKPEGRKNGNWEGIQEGVLTLDLVHIKTSIVEVQEALFVAKGR